MGKSSPHIHILKSTSKLKQCDKRKVIHPLHYYIHISASQWRWFRSWGQHTDTHMTSTVTHLPTLHLHVPFHGEGDDSGDSEGLCPPGVGIKDGENPQAVGMGRIFNPLASVRPHTTLRDLRVDRAVVTLEVTFATISVQGKNEARLCSKWTLLTWSITHCGLSLYQGKQHLVSFFPQKPPVLKATSTN